MFCKHCGKEIDDNAFVCIHCGSLVKEITTEKPDYEKKTNGMAIAGFVCSFFIPLLGWIFGGIGLSRSKKLDGKEKGFSISALIISTIEFFVYLGNTL